MRSIGIVAPPAPPGGFGRSLGDLARQLWWERRLRTGFFPPEILGEPAWDLILHLFASEAAGAATRLSKAHEGACVPPSAAIARARTLMALGIVREPDAGGKKGSREIGLAPLAKSRLEHLLIEMAVQRDVRRDDGALVSKADACDAKDRIAAMLEECRAALDAMAAWQAAAHLSQAIAALERHKA
jgi:hypothetical protein